jgi:hypothetical protein
LTPFSPVKPSFHSAKEAIFVFVNHLAQSPIQDLLDTRRFLTLQKEFLDCYPQYNHIVYHRCIELFLKTQKLSREDYESVFPEIPLIDNFNTNKDQIHVSSISNALVISNLIKYHTYFKEKIILQDKPMKSYPGERLMEKLQVDFPEQMKINIQQTGQATPDLKILFASGFRQYDIKQTGSIPYTGNKLSPVDYDSLMYNLKKNYFPEITSHLVKERKKNESFMTADEKAAQDYMLNEINKIHQNHSLSLQEKNHNIHLLLLNSESFSIQNRPSILFATTTKPFSLSVSENILNQIYADVQTAGSENGSPSRNKNCFNLSRANGHTKS